MCACKVLSRIRTRISDGDDFTLGWFIKGIDSITLLVVEFPFTEVVLDDRTYLAPLSAAYDGQSDRFSWGINAHVLRPSVRDRGYGGLAQQSSCFPFNLVD